METYTLPEQVVERPTIGVVMRAFNWPDYDIWLGAMQKPSSEIVAPALCAARVPA